MTDSPDTTMTRADADADVLAQVRRARGLTRRQGRRRERERWIADPRRRLGAAALTGLGYGTLSMIPIGRLSHARTGLTVGGAVAGLFGVGVVRSVLQDPECSRAERWRRGGVGVTAGGALGALVGASTWCSLKTDAWLEHTARRLGAGRPRLWVGALVAVLTAATDFAERTPRSGLDDQGDQDDQDGASAGRPARSTQGESTTLAGTGIDPAITGEPPEEQAPPQ